MTDSRFVDVPLRLPADLVAQMTETARIEGVTLSQLVTAVFE
jgi:hypothetical protein